MKITPLFDEADIIYQKTRVANWNSIAKKRDHWRGMGRWYHRRVNELYQYPVSPNQRVLEIGCGMGSLFSHLQPSHGVDADFSTEMIARAKKLHPEFEYHLADAHDLSSIGSNDITQFLAFSTRDLHSTFCDQAL